MSGARGAAPGRRGGGSRRARAEDGNGNGNEDTGSAPRECSREVSEECDNAPAHSAASKPTNEDP
ncbi:hypothetical protein GCM10023324_53270 [Streptomyces youssoufiensis]